MAKKIAEVPIPKENFLHGYKPITPKFAEDDEEDVKEDTPAEEKPVEQKPSEKKSLQNNHQKKRYIERPTSPKRPRKGNIAKSVCLRSILS